MFNTDTNSYALYNNNKRRHCAFSLYTSFTSCDKLYGYVLEDCLFGVYKASIKKIALN